MRNKFFLFLLVIGLLPGCTENFDEINSNPNEPEAVPLTNLLISGISRGVDIIGGASMNMTYAGLWAQHYAKIQYIDEDYYQFRESAMESHWSGLYAGPLQDLQEILNNPEAGENMKAAAMTMQAYICSVVTDMWGEVPYSEALDVENYIQPKYDSQEGIYNDLVSKLEMAAGMFDPAGDDLGAGDVLYGGDISRWTKLANSLRLRLLNRMKHKDSGAQAAATALAANTAALLESNADDAMLYFPGDAAWPNPLYENRYLDARNDHASSKTMVDLLTAINDPRLAVYAKPNGNGDYVGQPNGTDQPANLSDISPIGAMYRDDPTGGIPIMTHAEVQFIRAEVLGDKDAYMAGIQASMDRNGVSADDAYMAAAGAFYDSDAKTAVLTHKWVDLFGNGCEAFTEVRRTGIPAAVQEVPGSAYPGAGLPNRFAYPGIEVSTNSANLNEARGRQSITANLPLHGNRMWWTEE